MELGAIVEVAIGIIFVWIVLSLTTIQIQEWITTSIMDKRARDMEEAIHEMLANPNLKAQFYDHPVIRGLTAKKRREPSPTYPWYYRYPLLRGFTKEKRKLPSYIPSQQFALTMFDIAMTAGTESSLIQQGILKIRDDLEKEKKLSPSDAVIVELNLLAELARSAAATEAGTAITHKTLSMLRTEAEQLVDNIKAKYPNLQIDEEVEALLRAGIDRALSEAERLKGEIDAVLKKQPKDDLRTNLGKVRRGIAALSVISPEVNQTLNALLQNVEEYVTEGETHLARARRNIEKWFDDSMDRVSGAFKRESQFMALLIGLFIALILNVDSINLTLYLWRDSSVRQALVQNAEAFQIPEEDLADDPEMALKELRDKFSGLSLPVGWVLNDTTTGGVPDRRCQLMPGEFQTFGVRVPFVTKCLAPPQADNQTNLILKLIGICLTALAARQGAPFWFDILKKTVNLRGTGANPAEKDK